MFKDVLKEVLNKCSCVQFFTNCFLTSYRSLHAIHCYPKTCMLNPDPQCGGIRGGSWEVLRSQGWSPTAFVTGTYSTPHPLPCVNQTPNLLAPWTDLGVSLQSCIWCSPNPAPSPSLCLFWQPEGTLYLDKLRPKAGVSTATPEASLETTGLQLELYWSMAILCVHGWFSRRSLQEQRGILWGLESLQCSPSGPLGNSLPRCLPTRPPCSE